MLFGLLLTHFLFLAFLLLIQFFHLLLPEIKIKLRKRQETCEKNSIVDKTHKKKEKKHETKSKKQNSTLIKPSIKRNIFEIYLKHFKYLHI